MEKKARRTPEQLAAYHQAKANAARAKAAKKARADDTRLKILVGAAIMKSFVEGSYTFDNGGQKVTKWAALWGRVESWLDERDKEFVRAELSRRMKASG